MKIPILFENSHALFIDKPSGIVVHKDLPTQAGEKSNEYTIADWLKENYKVKGVGEKEREGIVHRLDRNTTGVLLLAKDNIAYTSFKKQFLNHKVRKVYRAIVEGNIKNDTGMISLPLSRSRSDFRKRTVTDMYSKDMRGEEKEATTRYKVLNRVTNKLGSFSYVEVYPLTGRTHQIRAHFRGIRHPIIGDDLYGSKKGKDLAKRSMLHAYSLTIVVPKDNVGKEEVNVVSEIPKDMKEILKKLEFSNR